MAHSSMDVVRQMREAKTLFWAQHPELVRHRRKVLVLLQLTDTGFTATWRWKNAADRRLGRLMWLERRLGFWCPDKLRWWHRMLLWVTGKLRIT